VEESEVMADPTEVAMGTAVEETANEEDRQEVLDDLEAELPDALDEAPDAPESDGLD
jgi:hypothetical protein